MKGLIVMSKKILMLIGILMVSLILGVCCIQKKDVSENKIPLQNETWEKGTSQYHDQVVQEKKAQYRRQNITFLKFVSSENCMYSLDTEEVKELKSLNINGIKNLSSLQCQTRWKHK
ncbi:hypothetical protein DRP05_10490 [Archaeoglobales archaeon]|nr:MAG: hypothetical protein DRP05_10490 [Archaeoglobales archaeon]